jgi:hypothetical protein
VGTARVDRRGLAVLRLARHRQHHRRRVRVRAGHRRHGTCGDLDVALAEWNKTNLTKALNGGTVTVTGTTTTTLTQIDPPDVGQETRIMVGWQSEDNTVRFIGRQALQTGDVSAGFRKGADNATMAIVWRFEKPSAGGAPYSIYLAGATRGA